MNISIIKRFRYKNRENDLLDMINSKYQHAESRVSGYFKDKDNHYYPWYTYSAIEYLTQFNYKNKFVFEWGAGFSSLFWAERAKNVFSIENDYQWYRRIKSIKPKNLNIIFKNKGTEYINEIGKIKKKFDVIIIDGTERLECAKIAIKFLKKGGIIILDNSDWFPKSSKLLKEKNYLEIDFSGIGPVNNYTWTTSIYFDNNFSFKTLNKKQPLYSLGAIKINAEK